MKYLISWTYRAGGSAAELEESTRRGLAVFSKWTPTETSTFHQFLGRLDGEGGFAVIETDNPMDLNDAPSMFGPYVKYEIYPVAEIAETMQSMQRGVEFRDSIG
ncbi:DUF3303 domain-containing protein [Rhodococcus sp. SRB_17]|uniref:DUF3303 domain-containing protein n=1 Tax=Rhodococcus sp. OK302 TaxID=1882769 RepID=UPI000B942509|nr:DUF3303 family protein [Rhodococcus sp. OK302]NMM88357.1 DUF3303 domain-containing protein [Rhodococcus sp. SRB_17]OYD69314.1 uncharacterized protein DUF3303 [Rhodococcus sp. OK302]